MRPSAIRSQTPMVSNNRRAAATIADARGSPAPRSSAGSATTTLHDVPERLPQRDRQRQPGKARAGDQHVDLPVPSLFPSSLALRRYRLVRLIKWSLPTHDNRHCITYVFPRSPQDRSRRSGALSRSSQAKPDGLHLHRRPDVTHESADRPTGRFDRVPGCIVVAARGALASAQAARGPAEPAEILRLRHNVEGRNPRASHNRRGLAASRPHHDRTLCGSTICKPAW